jgi:hypothetical protein
VRPFGIALGTRTPDIRVIALDTLDISDPRLLVLVARDVAV